MSPLIFIVWMLNVVVDTGGQLAFKAAAAHGDEGGGMAHWRAMARRPWLWLGIIFFCAEFIFWLVFLSLVPLSEGILLGSLNIVAVLVGGRLIFNERLNSRCLLGIFLIAAGVAIVGLA